MQQFQDSLGVTFHSLKWNGTIATTKQTSKNGQVIQIYLHLETTLWAFLFSCICQQNHLKSGLCGHDKQIIVIYLSVCVLKGVMTYCGLPKLQSVKEYNFTRGVVL